MPMPAPDPDQSTLEATWTDHRIWSLTASRLKRRIDRARNTALLLAVATAVLTTTASQLGSVGPVSRGLTATAAITAGVATVVQRRAGSERIRAWTRARSASEGLKSEIYRALAGGARYLGPDRAEVLSNQARDITGLVHDLARHAFSVSPDDRPVPPVRDVDGYLTLRVNQQIDGYYIPRARRYDVLVGRLRVLGDVLGATAAVLAALGAAFDLRGLAQWVPVITTTAAALTAHIAANRYDHQVMEFLRTAQRLAELRDTFLRTPGSDPAAFIDDCEDAISVENQAWMARWNQPSA